MSRAPAGGIINLSAEEKKVYGQLFKQCDPETLGIVTGEVARTLFERSGLSARILGEIWQLADNENNGFLDQSGFALALRLISHAQAGQAPAANLAANPTNLALFDGKPRPDPGNVSNNTSANTSNNITNNTQLRAQYSGIKVPALSPGDRTRFLSLFQKSAPSGLLDGEQARTIFTKARLPNETLGQIWALADTKGRGQLDQTEFIIAMHFIQCVLNGSLAQLPNQLPPALYEAAAGRPPSVVNAPGGPVRPPSVMSPNFTGPRRVNTASPLTPQPWTVAPSEKQRFDAMFESLDKQHRGLIGAPEVVPFMTRSKLPENVLAQIWDLADMHNTGEFSKTEFAIAMYLVQQKLNGIELPNALPHSLVASLTLQQQPSTPVPASSAVPQSVNQHQPPQQPPARTMSGSLNDLVALNDIFATPSPKPQPPTAAAPPASTSAPPQQGIKRQTTGEVRSFVPSSTFGQTLLSSQPPAPAPASTISPAPGPDLLGTDAAPPPTSAADSVELANLSNQISSLTEQTVALTQKRERTEQELKQTSDAKAEITKKLALLRTTYDSEVKRVQEVQVELDRVKQEYEKLYKEYAMIEGSLNAMKGQYETVANQLATSRAEHSSIREKIRAANEETASLKAAYEAAQKESRQHASVLAVSQSQLEVAQSDRRRYENEVADLRAANEDSLRKIAEIDQETRIINEQNEEKKRQLSEGGNRGEQAASSETVSAEAASTAGSMGRASPGNPFAFVQHETPFDEAFRNMSLSDAERKDGGIARATTEDMSVSHASHVTEGGTPSSTPPTSEFTGEFNTGPQIPSFTLPIARPGSATSSVQNNPPQSVRGDISSQPDSPADAMTEPVSGIVPPESLDLNDDGSNDHEGELSTARLEEEQQAEPAQAEHLLAGAVSNTTLSGRDRELRESDGSYEFVDEPEDRVAAAKVGAQGKEEEVEKAEPPVKTVEQQEQARQESSLVEQPSSIRAQIPGGFPGSSEEFPPIRELEQDEDSSSDEEQESRAKKEKDDDKFLTPESTGHSGQAEKAAPVASNVVPPVAAVPSNVISPVAAGPSSQAHIPDETEFSFSFNEPTPTGITATGAIKDDPFDSAFSGLSEAKEERDESLEDEFDAAFKEMEHRHITEQASQIPMPGAAQQVPSSGQPNSDEWEQLFAGFGNGPSGQQEINDAFAPRKPLTPHSQAVQDLVGMGFAEEDAKDALEAKKYNLEEASNYLLDHTKN